jgi:hypothetical protein
MPCPHFARFTGKSPSRRDPLDQLAHARPLFQVGERKLKYMQRPDHDPWTLLRAAHSRALALSPAIARAFHRARTARTRTRNGDATPPPLPARPSIQRSSSLHRRSLRKLLLPLALGWSLIMSP